MIIISCEEHFRQLTRCQAVNVMFKIGNLCWCALAARDMYSSYIYADIMVTSLMSTLPFSLENLSDPPWPPLTGVHCIGTDAVHFETSFIKQYPLKMVMCPGKPPRAPLFVSGRLPFGFFSSFFLFSVLFHFVSMQCILDMLLNKVCKPSGPCGTFCFTLGMPTHRGGESCLVIRSWLKRVTFQEQISTTSDGNRWHCFLWWGSKLHLWSTWKKNHLFKNKPGGILIRWPSSIFPELM